MAHEHNHTRANYDRAFAIGITIDAVLNLCAIVVFAPNLWPVYSLSLSAGWAF